MKYSTLRDLVALDLYRESQKPFLKSAKGGGEEITVGAEVWKSLENLEKAAGRMHKDFKGLWKWVKSRYPWPENEDYTKRFLQLDLTNLLFLLLYEENDELNRWKEGLKFNKWFDYVLPEN